VKYLLSISDVGIVNHAKKEDIVQKSIFRKDEEGTNHFLDISFVLSFLTITKQ
jgi:hypothetical protein